MMIVKVTSKVTVDTEHGVTNQYSDIFITETEEGAKEAHRRDLQKRFSSNPYYGGVYKQTVTQA